VTLPIFAGERLVGEVRADPDGPHFTYDPAWIRDPESFPLSVTMPLAQPDIGPAKFLVWASNLLPEAEQLVVTTRRLGMSRDDIIGLLAAIGRDTAGALSFGAPGYDHSRSWRRVDTPGDLERLIEELPAKPFLIGEDGVSMSLAGVQGKLAVAVDPQGQICIPLDGSPSTHILKPDHRRLYGSVQNEAYCLTLARRCGLPVPGVTTGVAGGRTYFLIERYDRLRQGGQWRRLHQEDFCQVLEKPAAAKYERNSTGIRGPTVADMLGSARRHATGPDILRLFDAVVFNVLACNTDAHAKNYSLLIGPGDRVRAAPLYDVLCAEVFDGVTRNLAQTVAGKARGDHLKRRHWLRLAAACGLSGTLTLRRIGALASRVGKNAGLAREQVEAMPAGGHPLLPAVVEAITRRSRAIIAGLDDMDGVDV
jgi:serine/threonine-protein kinase HipA